MRGLIDIDNLWIYCWMLPENEHLRTKSDMFEQKFGFRYS